MKRMAVGAQRFDEASVCAPLRIGYSKLFPDIQITIDEQEIINHPRVRRCIDLLNAGIDFLPFHGYDSLESANKIFCEHFVDVDNVHNRRCRDQLIKIKDTEQLYGGIGTPGYLLDDYQLGGSHIIRAACLARTKVIDEAEIAGEIREAVDNFVRMKEVQDCAQLLEAKKGKQIVRKGGIPSYYHLQLLAFSESWRTEDTQARVCAGIRRLFALNMPPYYLWHKSQMIAPASLNLSGLTNVRTEFDMFWWFDVVKLLLMAGYNEERLISNIRVMLEKFEPDRIIRTYHFMKWGAYCGLALEPNWRSKIRKAYDLYYRVQEIEYLANSIDS